jgi:tripartite-type tricarboxylate transporter receptor subunit TctC
MTRGKRAAVLSAFAGAAIGLAAGCAAAQGAYPVKALRILVGAPAGGGTDVIARALADKLAGPLGQPVLVDNRPGASNTIAADLTAKAPPDGYTLLLATNTGQAIAPHLLKLGFDPIRDLTPVALVVVVPNVLVVGPAVPAKDVRELVALIRSRPGEFKYASSGIGSTQHLAGEGFAYLTGVKMIHVPYKGSSQAQLDLIGGEVQIMFDTTSSAMGQIRAGKLRALAVTTAARSSELPNVPTLAEAGFPGFEMSTWYGLYVTGGTPPAVVARLQAEMARVIKLPEVQARLKGLGGEPGDMSPAQFAALNRAEYARFGKLIRDAGIRIEGQ